MSNQETNKEQNEETNKFKVFSRPIILPNFDSELIKSSNIYTWGKQNVAPYELNNLYSDSKIHKGIIDNKVRYIVSGGLKYIGQNQTLFNTINANYESEYSIQEIIEHLALDFEIFNGFAIKGKWRVGGGAILEFIDFADLRVTKEDAFGNIQYLYSEDWTERNAEKNAEVYEAFNPNKRVGNFVMYWSEKPIKRVGRDKKIIKAKYPQPNYSGAIVDILSEIEVARFGLSELLNQFSVGTMINFTNGIPDPTEKKKFEREFHSKVSGADGAGGYIINYSEGENTAPEVISLQGNNQPERYLNYVKMIQSNILYSHGVTSPSLFGIQREGAIFGATEMETAYSIMKANYFKVRQDKIAKVLQYLFKEIYSLDGQIEFENVQLPWQSAAASVAQATTPQTSFSATEGQKKKSDSHLISLFKDKGIEFDSSKVISAFDVDDFEMIEQREKDLLNKKEFAIELTEIESKILLQIKNGESYSAIKNILKLNDIQLTAAYNKFINNSLITSNNVVTSEGNSLLTSDSEIDIEVRYSYELRSNAPALSAGGKSREFCAEMVKLNRLYTRDEINQISNDFGENVWLFKGGWYRNPETNTNEPACRHTWRQNLIRK
jgi:hypothetical protein